MLFQDDVHAIQYFIHGKRQNNAVNQKLAIDYIYKKHFKSLFKYIFKISKNQASTEDILQEVFLSFIELEDSRLQEIIANPKTNIGAYLATASYHRYLRLIKTNKKEITDDNIEMFEDKDSEIEKIEWSIDKQILLNHLDNIIIKIKEEERTLIYLLYFDDTSKSIQEIADGLNIRRNTLDVKYHRIKIKIQKIIKKSNVTI